MYFSGAGSQQTWHACEYSLWYSSRNTCTHQNGLFVFLFVCVFFLNSPAHWLILNWTRVSCKSKALQSHLNSFWLYHICTDIWLRLRKYATRILFGKLTINIKLSFGFWLWLDLDTLFSFLMGKKTASALTSAADLQALDFRKRLRVEGGWVGTLRMGFLHWPGGRLHSWSSK